MSEIDDDLSGQIAKSAPVSIGMASKNDAMPDTMPTGVDGMPEMPACLTKPLGALEMRLPPLLKAESICPICGKKLLDDAKPRNFNGSIYYVCPVCIPKPLSAPSTVVETAPAQPDISEPPKQKRKYVKRNRTNTVKPT